MKAFELRRLEPYSRLSAQQLMDLVTCCQELSIATGRRFEVRGQTMRGQCFLLHGSVQICAPGKRHAQILETVDYRDPRARRPLLSTEVPERHIITQSKSRILVVNTEVERRAGSVQVTPIGASDESTWMKVFLGSAVTRKLTPTDLRDLFREFTSEPAKAGQVIGEIGEQSSRFHVIKKGQVRISNQVTLAVLGPGEFFGEDSLIRHCVRNAHIRMLSDGELLSIGAEAFRRLLRTRFVRSPSREMSPVRVNLVDDAYPKDNTTHMNIRLASLRSSLHLFDPDLKYVLAGQQLDVELAAFILTHHGFQVFAETCA